MNLTRLRIRICSIMHVCDLSLEVAHALAIVQQYKDGSSRADECQYHHHHRQAGTR